MNITSEVVAISGAAGRIGSNLVRYLLEKNFRVVAGDINKKKINNLKKEINSKNVFFFIGDLTKYKSIDNFIKIGIDKFGEINSAINCSYPKNDWGKRFENIKQHSLNNNIANHLGGAIIFAQRFTKYFLKNKKGNLINFSSIQGITQPKFDHYKNLKMGSPIEYSAIKSGIISITKYLAKYYKYKNLRFNCISPGGIKDNQHKLFIKRYKASCSKKGLLDPEDLFSLVSFLLSNKSQYINGQNIIIDDGWSL
jgi:NAD(P)-dependent dehydrogenase (short-subunit alcohol dehydrogenase family)